MDWIEEASRTAIEWVCDHHDGTIAETKESRRIKIERAFRQTYAKAQRHGTDTTGSNEITQILTGEGSDHPRGVRAMNNKETAEKWIEALANAIDDDIEIGPELSSIEAMIEDYYAPEAEKVKALVEATEELLDMAEWWRAIVLSYEFGTKFDDEYVSDAVTRAAAEALKDCKEP